MKKSYLDKDKGLKYSNARKLVRIDAGYKSKKPSKY